MHASDLAKPLGEDQPGMVLATIARAAVSSSIARRDWVMVNGSHLMGCRASELCRRRWQDIEPLASGGQVHLLGKGSKPRTIRVSTGTLEIFESLGRSEPEGWLFPFNRRDGPLSRQAVTARMARWGREAGVRLHPHQLRHTHAIHAIRKRCRCLHASGSPSATSPLVRQVMALLLSLVVTSPKPESGRPSHEAVPFMPEEPGDKSDAHSQQAYGRRQRARAPTIYRLECVRCPAASTRIRR